MTKCDKACDKIIGLNLFLQMKWQFGKILVTAKNLYPQPTETKNIYLDVDDDVNELKPPSSSKKEKKMEKRKDKEKPEDQVETPKKSENVLYRRYKWNTECVRRLLLSIKH